ncbi:hypothetical protein Poli38472_012441 [Pythium oligandrum]|uniref:Uncharacterized protein n=1 Tax=Pythium oligandrum TaxID=41045 RepID=A0A8K1CRC4_PYTOL|nr:hypothetical protein Poli38472_012441 [Pythium oligandrum]|eukprot:TMW67325.1 hypothetical protein Poli38472_012441 [Pythium oligandrum]
MSGRRISVLLLVIAVICDITNAALSIPTAQDASGAHAESIKATASKISNGKRTHTTGGTSYAVYTGPSYSTNGSLTAQMQHEEQKKLANFRPSFIKRALNKVANSGIVLKNTKGLLDLYDILSSEFDKPMASDNSDLTFARQRVTYRSFALRPAVLKDLKGIHLDLYDSQLHEKCGCAMADMWRSTTFSRASPLTLTTRMQLGELLLHLIFTATVRNQMASGMATWHSLNLPYSPAALWEPMLNETLKYDEWVPPREYTAPSGLVASVIEYSASFYKQIPASESMLGVYKTAPFKDEPRLTRAIAELHERLAKIDAIITDGEQKEAWPFELLRPSRLP